MLSTAGGTESLRSISSQDPWLARITGSMGMPSCESGSPKSSSRLSPELDILGDDRPSPAKSPRKGGGSVGIPVLS